MVALDDPKPWDAYTADMLRLNEQLMKANAALLAACEAGYSELWCASESGTLELDSCKEVLQQMWAAIKLAKEGANV